MGQEPEDDLFLFLSARLLYESISSAQNSYLFRTSRVAYRDFAMRSGKLCHIHTLLICYKVDDRSEQIDTSNLKTKP